MTIANDALGSGFLDVLRPALANLLPVTKGACYICVSSSEWPTLHRAWKEAGGKWSSTIIWVKNTPALGRAIRNSSKQRDTVLDSFGGSGTTMIAAERTGRRAVLLEIDPAYADVIVRRWQEMAGETAVLDGEGRTFGDIAAAHGRQAG